MLSVAYRSFSHYLNLISYVVATLAITLWLSCEPSNKRAEQQKSTYATVLDSANHLYDAGHHEEAVRFLDSLTTSYNSLSFGQKAEFNTIHYNYYLHIKRDNGKALQYANELLKISQFATNNEERILTYSKARFFRGDVLFRQNKYNEAYLNYYQGKVAASNSNRFHDCMLGDYSYHMGMILYKQEHYRLAAQYFRTSFNETQTCSMTFRSFYRRQELLNNVGISYIKINELDSALLYFDKALAYINNAPLNYKKADTLLQAARGVIYGNQASVYDKYKRLSKAKALLKKSIAINVQKGFDNNDALLSELKLVEIYDKQNQVDSMLPVLRVAERQLENLKNDAAFADWNKLMAIYYEQKGQLGKAITHLKQFNAIQTLVYNKTLALKATDITEQLKRFERDYEVNRLKKTNEQKTIYLGIAVVFFAMALIILLLIYLNSRKSKKLLNTMRELNEQINSKNEDLHKALSKLEQSNQDKDRILRTVAHDLRNPIGGIASLTTSVLEDEDCPGEQKEYFKLVKDTAYNSLELINEIMEATNTHADDLNKQWVDINALLNNSVELLRFRAAEKNQQILLEVLPEPLDVFISREKNMACGK